MNLLLATPFRLILLRQDSKKPIANFRIEHIKNTGTVENIGEQLRLKTLLKRNDDKWIVSKYFFFD